MSRFRNKAPGYRQTGMSLVEILVGVAIGLIGIIAMFQVMENWETRKRTTSSGSDAQMSGSIALYRLERDLKLAGFGFTGDASSGSSRLGCTVSAYDSARATGTSFTFLLTPVQITNGASGAPDTITVLYGDSAIASMGQPFTASTVTTKKVDVRAGYQRGDLAIVAESATACKLVEITGDSNADGRTIDHLAGGYTNAAGTAVTARHNPAGGHAVSSASGTIYNLGPRAEPRRNIWQIRDGQLLALSDDLHYTDTDGDGQNDWAEVGNNIINLQAEYGLDTTATRDYLVDAWQATAPTDWTRVIAIRVAILARSQQLEKTPVTTTAPTWAGGAFTMTNVDGSADSAPGGTNDWRYYRYRVYQTSIPLRNMLWGTAP